MPSSERWDQFPHQPYAANSQQAIAQLENRFFRTHTIARLELWLAGAGDETAILLSS